MFTFIPGNEKTNFKGIGYLLTGTDVDGNIQTLYFCRRKPTNFLKLIEFIFLPESSADEEMILF